MAGKSAILAVRIIGDATGATKALKETETGLDKLAPAAAIAGAASAAALTAGFADAVSVEAGLSKVQGQLGLSTAEAERVGIVSGELFANGWGTGADQINEALTGVIGNIDGMRTASDEQLTGISEKVLTVANTFDQDLGGITTAVGQLMRTGLAPDAESALDLITTGLQTNTRAGDDLLDTFTEYPALFERLGIDGQTATGLISQGLDAGARSTDLVADALKEFQIRATDGSAASAEGFKALGLDAGAMTAQIAAGGEGAAQGLDQVLDSLRGMTDPVAQNAAAVQLFGTQAEDLGSALYALDPSSAVDALGTVTGSAEKLGDTMSDNTQQTITEFARAVQTSFQEIGAKAIPVIEPVIALMKEFAPIIGPLAVVIGTLSTALLVINGVMKAWAVVQGIATAAQWASNAAWLANPITWIILAVIAVIALLVAAILLIIENWDEIARVAGEVWANVCAWIQTAVDWLVGAFNDAIAFAAGVWQSILDAAAAVWNAIITWIVTVIMWVTVRIILAVIAAAEVWNRIKETAIAVFQAVISWVQQAISWVRDGIAGAVNGVLGFFTNFRDTVVGVFQTVIQWVKNAIDWIANLASNAVPGWAKDLLGMSSARMFVQPELLGLETPSFASRMALTPDLATLDRSSFATTTDAAPVASKSVSTFAAVESLLNLPSSRAVPAAPSVVDNSTNNFNFPNYIGTRAELLEWIEEALSKKKQRSERIIFA